MKTFRYVGTEPDGTACSGEIAAASADAARKTLQDKGLKVESINEIEQPDSTHDRLTPAEASEVNAQISNIVSGGLPLAEGLRAAADEFQESGLLRRILLLDLLRGVFLQRSDARIRRALYKLAADVEKGESLDDALRLRSRPAEVSAVLQSGITSEAATIAIGEYSTYADTSAKLRNHVLFLFAYPLVALSAAIALLGVFFCFLVPPVRQILDGFDVELPAITQFVFAISDGFLAFGPLTVIAGPIVATIVLVLFFAHGHSMGNRVSRALPLLGASFRSLELSRTSHLLAVVLRHNAPIPGALRAAGLASGNTDVSTACKELAHIVEAGHTLPAVEPALPGLPLSFLQIAQSGSDRNTVADALHSLATMFEHRARVIMSLLAAVVQPFVLIVVGGSVVVCFYGLFFPIVKLLNDLA